MKTFTLAMLIALVGVAPAAAAVVTRCGASDGYTYFVEGGLVQGKDVGWQKDRTSAGSYLLLRDGNTFDLIFSDAMNRTISSKEDGAQIILLSEQEGTLALLVNYPGRNVEIWVFDIDAAGRGTVTFHQARYGREFPVRKHGVMRAACSK